MWMMLHSLLLLLVVGLVLRTINATPWLANNDDEDNMRQLRDLIPEGKRLLPSWFDPNVAPCNWSGITCSNESIVTKIDLSGVPLRMTAPSCFGEFQNLKQLILSNCKMFGIIPETIGSLRSLEFLDLSSNSFSGQLPKSLTNLSGLLHLDISSNSFQGSIFPTIGFFENLITLNVEHNKFTGALSSDIGKLTNLQILRMGFNNFMDNLPLAINNMKALKVFMIQKCKMNGLITEGIFIGLQHMEMLDISRNFFSGPLPISFAKLTTVKMFNLRRNQLEGSLPDWISRWQSAVSINLGENLFNGSLPSLHIKMLKSFIADNNQLSGSVTSDICYGNALITIDLSRNRLIGKLNQAFRYCTKLEILMLSNNKFYGDVPNYMSNIPLVKLDLSHNKFTELVPWNSQKLTHLFLSNNKFGGQLPYRISEMSSLEELQLSNNFFEGMIPKSIGKLKNLTNLSLNGNKLLGWIPGELFDCINLVSLNLGSNHLTGPVPKSISQLKLLMNLDLSSNQFFGIIPSEICAGFQQLTLPKSQFTERYGVLDLSNNNLIGSIPAAVRNCTLVKELRLQGNTLNGSMPPELFNLKNLTYIDLSMNSLTGPFPPQLLPSTELQGIFLSSNELDGPIPIDLSWRFPNLVKLNLSCNKLIGAFPNVIFSMESLTTLDLSHNLLSGPIPYPKHNVEKPSSLLILKAGDNNFTGIIAKSLPTDLPSLSILDLHGNNINGRLPSSFVDFEYLTFLDLSNNNLDGAIPCGICTSLFFVNLLGNKFSSYEPPNCHAEKSDRCPHFPPSKSRTLLAGWGWIIAIVSIVSFVVCTFTTWYFGLLKCRRLRHNIISLVSGNKEAYQAEIELVPTERLLPRFSTIACSFTSNVPRQLTLENISSATENFNESHIIGRGGFGTVYKAVLGDQLVAVKRLSRTEDYKCQAEFKAEMETLGKVKHPNLVALLGYCATDEHFLLIYDYLGNGSLDRWLWNRVAATGTSAAAVETLGWPARFRICLGSARGLECLHHVCKPRIIHRDIKSSNILLDQDLEPRVCDFGLARLLADDETHVDTILAGTIGYFPPEYPNAMMATTRGDVYSFGVVILEILTGKPPIGEQVAEGGGNLVFWVRWMARQGKEAEVFDKCLPTSGRQRVQMVKVLEVANACTIADPRARPTMHEVVGMLNHIDGNPSTSRSRG